MKKNWRNKYIIIAGLIAASISSVGQMVVLDPDAYEQEFLGTGASFDLWLGHYLSHTEENQLKSAGMLFGELRLRYMKEYPNSTPQERPDRYDGITIIYNQAKQINPDIEMVVTPNDLPDHLERIQNGEPVKGEHNRNIPGIMDSVANYYFQVVKGYHDRGVPVTILELVNERGFGDGRVTELFEEAATKFKELINDPAFNTTGVPMPLIAGPSTWSAASPKTFINGWKADNPIAWANTDIVTTHAYQEGTEASFQGTFDVSDGKLFFQSEQTAKIQRDEAPGIDPIADQFPDEGYDFDYLANVTIARHMIEFFNGGGNAFFHFNSNNAAGSNAALIRTQRGSDKVPLPSTPFYGFKHLSGTHPRNSFKVTQTLTDTENLEVVAFRKPDEDTLYVHFINLYDTPEQLTIDFGDNGIKSAKVWSTDETLRFDVTIDTSYASSVDKITYSASPYSVNTVKVLLDPTGPQITLAEQTITFTSLSDVHLNQGVVNLTATSSSGLPVHFELVEGNASLSNNQLTLAGIGFVTVKAVQEGNESFLGASEIYQTFRILPNASNIALGSSVSASGQFRNNTPPEDAVDGDISTNGSRWIAPRNDETPLFEQWMEIDFGRTASIKAFQFYTGFDGYNNPIYEFDFQVSINGFWVNVVSENINLEPIYLRALNGLKTDKVRFYMENAPEDFTARIYEMEVYGELSPVSPSTLSLVNVDSNQAEITWSDLSDNEDGFILERKVGTGSFEEIVQLGVNVTSFIDQNLTPDTHYEYRVAALNNVDKSGYSNELVVTTIDVLPASPVALSVDSVGAQIVKISWTDNSENEDGFILERDNGSGFAYLDSLENTITNYSDETVNSNTDYVYRVASFNEIGNSFSSEIPTKTLPIIPKQPSGLTAVAFADNIELSWLDNSEVETYFIVERRSDGEAFTKVDSVQANSSLYLDVKLNELTTYTYRVTAKGPDGLSDYTQEASATTEKVLGLNDSFNLKVFPNPVEDELNIQFSNFKGGFLNIDLLDLTGRKVKTIFSDFLSDKSLNIRLNDLKSDKDISQGFYILEFSLDEMKLKERLIIK